MISSCFIMFHHVSSCFIMFHHVSSCFIMFHHFSSFFISPQKNICGPQSVPSNRCLSFGWFPIVLLTGPFTYPSIPFWWSLNIWGEFWGCLPTRVLCHFVPVWPCRYVFTWLLPQNQNKQQHHFNLTIIV